MRRLPKMAAALLAAALAVSAALPALAADQRAELELEAVSYTHLTLPTKQRV